MWQKKLSAVENERILVSINLHVQEFHVLTYELRIAERYCVYSIHSNFKRVVYTLYVAVESGTDLSRDNQSNSIFLSDFKCFFEGFEGYKGIAYLEGFISKSM